MFLEKDDQSKAEKKYVNGMDTGDDVFCPRCKQPNDAGALKCNRCGMPLSEEALMQLQSKDDDIKALKNQVALIETLILKGQPDNTVTAKTLQEVLDQQKPVSDGGMNDPKFKTALDRYLTRNGLTLKSKKKAKPQKKRKKKEAKK